MANRKQIGTDYLLFVNTGTTESPVWKIPLCQTTVTLNSPMDTIDASSKCGNDTLTELGTETVEMEGQTLQKDATNVNHMSLYDYRQIFRANEEREFKVGPKGETEADDGKIIYSFTGRITNVSDSYANKEIATVSTSITVVGQIEETEFVYTT